MSAASTRNTYGLSEKHFDGIQSWVQGLSTFEEQAETVEYTIPTSVRALFAVWQVLTPNEGGGSNGYTAEDEGMECAHCSKQNGQLPHFSVLPFLPHPTGRGVHASRDAGVCCKGKRAILQREKPITSFQFSLFPAVDLPLSLLQPACLQYIPAVAERRSHSVGIGMDKEAYEEAHEEAR